MVLRHDGYFVTYFHPWEFYPLGEHPELKISWLVRKNAGDEMARRLDRLIKSLKEDGADFRTFSEFTEEKIPALQNQKKA